MSRLYVGNLNSSITKQRLADTFIKYGPLVDIWYNSDKCYAFIEYESSADAQDAIRQLNKKRFLGLELKVELTKYKRNNHGSPPRTDDVRDIRSRFSEPIPQQSRPTRGPRYNNFDGQSPPPLRRQYNSPSPPRNLNTHSPPPQRRYFSPSRAGGQSPPGSRTFPPYVMRGRPRSPRYRSPIRGTSLPYARSPPRDRSPLRGGLLPRDRSPLRGGLPTRDRSPQRVGLPPRDRSPLRGGLPLISRPPIRSPPRGRMPLEERPLRARGRSPGPPRGNSYRSPSRGQSAVYDSRPNRQHSPLYPQRAPLDSRYSPELYPRDSPAHPPDTHQFTPPRDPTPTIDLSKPLDIGRNKMQEQPPPPVFDPSKPLRISSNRPKPTPPVPPPSWRPPVQMHQAAPRKIDPPPQSTRSRSPLRTRYTDYRESNTGRRLASPPRNNITQRRSPPPPPFRNHQVTRTPPPLRSIPIRSPQTRGLPFRRSPPPPFRDNNVRLQSPPRNIISERSRTPPVRYTDYRENRSSGKRGQTIGNRFNDNRRN